MTEIDFSEFEDSSPPVEASAVTRMGARHMYQMHVALVEAGFTSNQALRIVGMAFGVAITQVGQ